MKHTQKNEVHRIMQHKVVLVLINKFMQDGCTLVVSRKMREFIYLFLGGTLSTFYFTTVEIQAIATYQISPSVA